MQSDCYLRGTRGEREREYKRERAGDQSKFLFHSRALDRPFFTLDDCKNAFRGADAPPDYTMHTRKNLKIDGLGRGSMGRKKKSNERACIYYICSLALMTISRDNDDRG